MGWGGGVCFDVIDAIIVVGSNVSGNSAGNGAAFVASYCLVHSL